MSRGWVGLTGRRPATKEFNTHTSHGCSVTSRHSLGPPTTSAMLEVRTKKKEENCSKMDASKSLQLLSIAKQETWRQLLVSHERWSRGCGLQRSPRCGLLLWRGLCIGRKATRCHLCAGLFSTCQVCLSHFGHVHRNTSDTLGTWMLACVHDVDWLAGSAVTVVASPGTETKQRERDGAGCIASAQQRTLSRECIWSAGMAVTTVLAECDSLRIHLPSRVPPLPVTADPHTCMLATSVHTKQTHTFSVP
jgi:hypothetical protein